MQVQGPLNMTAPVGVVAIMARLAPRAETFDDPEEETAEHTIMPHHLVFGKRAKQPTTIQFNHGRLTNQRHRPEVDTDVMNAWTNVHPDRAWEGVRCLGVSLEMMQIQPWQLAAAPDTSYFSVAVCGIVNLACDRSKITHALPGDIVFWTKETAEVGYLGGPTNHRSAIIKCTGPQGSNAVTAIDHGKTESVQVTLARDPIALAHLLEPQDTALTPQQAQDVVNKYSTVGGRIGRLLALGKEGTNEIRVMLDL